MLTGCMPFVVRQVHAQCAHTLQLLCVARVLLLKVLAGLVQICLMLSLCHGNVLQ